MDPYPGGHLITDHPDPKHWYIGKIIGRILMNIAYRFPCYLFYVTITILYKTCTLNAEYIGHVTLVKLWQRPGMLLYGHGGCEFCRSRMHSPWMGDIVDSGTDLSYRPANRPYAGVNFIPSVRDYEFGYWQCKSFQCFAPVSTVLQLSFWRNTSKLKLLL